MAKKRAQKGKEQVEVAPASTDDCGGAELTLEERRVLANMRAMTPTARRMLARLSGEYVQMFLAVDTSC